MSNPKTVELVWPPTGAIANPEADAIDAWLTQGWQRTDQKSQPQKKDAEQ